jgi:Serine kinase of the HPr protein, regulates carbohydrate metabolism
MVFGLGQPLHPGLAGIRIILGYKSMAIRNYLIEGVSGSGKTSVATELERRGYHVVHGDRVLAYQGDPETGAPLPPERRSDDLHFLNDHHIWDPEQIRALTADQSHAMTFFCGGSRNHDKFVHLFDAVFILVADWPLIESRLKTRTGEWGETEAERAITRELHRTGRDQPASGIRIDATRPLAAVVDAILAQC